VGQQETGRQRLRIAGPGLVEQGEGRGELLPGQVATGLKDGGVGGPGGVATELVDGLVQVVPALLVEGQLTEAGPGGGELRPLGEGGSPLVRSVSGASLGAVKQGQPVPGGIAADARAGAGEVRRPFVREPAGEDGRGLAILLPSPLRGEGCRPRPRGKLGTFLSTVLQASICITSVPPRLFGAWLVLGTLSA
jgi:hypothetical protein